MAAQVLPVDGLRLVKMLELCFMKLQLELKPETKILLYKVTCVSVCVCVR